MVTVISGRAFASALCSLAALVLVASGGSAQEATIVALGDSNTMGYGVAPQQAFPARLESRLRGSGRPVHVVNAGVAGDTFGQLAARVDSSLPPGTQLVIVQAGYNDLDQGVPPAISAANIRAVLAHLHARNVQAVLCGFFYKNWDAVGRSLAAEYHAAFVPGSTCYDPRNTGRDGLHMSAQGHAIVAARLARVVGPMLSNPNAFAAVKRRGSAAAPAGRP